MRGTKIVYYDSTVRCIILLSKDYSFYHHTPIFNETQTFLKCEFSLYLYLIRELQTNLWIGKFFRIAKRKFILFLWKYAYSID